MVEIVMGNIDHAKKKKVRNIISKETVQKSVSKLKT